MSKKYSMAGLALVLTAALAIGSYLLVDRSKKGPEQAPCAQLMIYGLRGTSPEPGPGGPALRVQRVAQEANITVTLTPADYPAEQDSPDEYLWSVQTGRDNTLRWLERTAERCKDSRLLVVGYSQGAQVAHLAMKDLEAQKFDEVRVRTWAVLVADPLRSPLDTTVEDFTVGGDAKGPGDYIVAYRADPVLLSPVSKDRVFSVCHVSDSVCNVEAEPSDEYVENPHLNGWATDEGLRAIEEWLDRTALNVT